MSRSRRVGLKKKDFCFFFGEKNNKILNFIKYLEIELSDCHKKLYLFGSIYEKQAHIIFIAGINL